MINNIKKDLLKSEPIAFFNYIRKGNAYYHCDLNGMEVWFEIPIFDMGDADFGSTMPSNLLLRWIYLIN